MKDIKYLFAYILPMSALWALWSMGFWAWTTVVLTFVALPIMEAILPYSTANVPEGEENERSQKPYFDILLYLNAPLLYAIVAAYLFRISTFGLVWLEIIGITLSTGIVVGAVGINVAHELGHRYKPWEQTLAKIMLLPALYQHFFIEHNRGHHKNVATDKDPSTARKNEVLYAFWARSVTGVWLEAWELEHDRLAKEGRAFWSFNNEMLRFQIIQLLYLAGVYLLWDWRGLLGALAVAIIGILLLETINYIEHYGLRRKLTASGRPEPVLPTHSWNSDFEIGRIFLYELTRHSDHHYKATRKYQVLRHMDQSPQLPAGYPASLLLALLPPVWFKVMNPRIPENLMPSAASIE